MLSAVIKTSALGIINYRKRVSIIPIKLYSIEHILLRQIVVSIVYCYNTQCAKVLLLRLHFPELILLLIVCYLNSSCTPQLEMRVFRLNTSDDFLTATSLETFIYLCMQIYEEKLGLIAVTNVKLVSR